MKQISKCTYQNKDVTERWNGQIYNDEDFGGGSGGERVVWWCDDGNNHQNTS